MCSVVVVAVAAVVPVVRTRDTKNGNGERVKKCQDNTINLSNKKTLLVFPTLCSKISSNV